LFNQPFLCLAYANISDNSSILLDSATFLNIATIFDTVFSLTVMQVWAFPNALLPSRIWKRLHDQSAV